MQAVKTGLGVPAELASCHTAEIGGYIIEGHVPAQAITRLIADKPDALGLAVPGMPIGSPGMEGGASSLRRDSLREALACELWSLHGRSTYLRAVSRRRWQSQVQPE
jgi:hypothetical protein